MNSSLTDTRFPLKICLFNIMLLLFIFRSSIPAFKYPFLVLYFCFIVYSFLAKKNILKNFRTFFTNYFLIITLIIIYFLSIVFSDKIFLEIFKDSLNILILFSFLLFLTLIITSKDELLFFTSELISCVILFSVIIALYDLYDFSHIYFSKEILLRETDSLMVDYNFALLPVFFGMLSILFLLFKINSRAKIIFYNILLLILTLPVFLSSSRRGFIIINIILSILYLAFLTSVFYKNNYLRSYVGKYKYYLIIITLLFGSVYFFVFETSYSFKQKAFEKIGIKRINVLQESITERCYRYLAILDKNTSYSMFYKKIWAPVFDPKDPDSGWGTRIHKTIFPLTGENVEIVPPGVKGYLMDSTCNAYIMGGNAYSYTDLYLYNRKVNDNDTVQVSVYCYVSKDFNGDWSLISLTNNNLGWIGSDAYDLENKGTWQKLTFSKSCKKGEISVYLFFCKTGVTDFTTMKGYLIFAFPESKIISSKDSSETDSGSLLIVTEKPDGESKIKSDKTLISRKYSEAGLYSSLHLVNNYAPGIDQDVIRKWASKFISEDTTYHRYYANIVVDTIRDSFLDMRYARWQFAWQIFRQEYNMKQKIFGNGFNFLNWYGYYFIKDKTKTDYPHNPFLYILLYSGIAGLIFYILLVYKAFYYYTKYIKQYYMLYIFFLISFFFTLFSGGNPFDPPVMGFFIILPFFIHSVHKKDDNYNKKSESKNK